MKKSLTAIIGMLSLAYACNTNSPSIYNDKPFETITVYSDSDTIVYVPQETMDSAVSAAQKKAAKKTARKGFKQWLHEYDSTRAASINDAQAEIDRQYEESKSQ